MCFLFSNVYVCCALPAGSFGSQYDRPSLWGVPVKLFTLSLKENGNGKFWAASTTLMAEHLHFVSRHPLHVEEAVDVGRRKAARPACGGAVLLCLGGMAMPTGEQDQDQHVQLLAVGDALS